MCDCEKNVLEIVPSVLVDSGVTKDLQNELPPRGHRKHEQTIEHVHVWLHGAGIAHDYI